VFVFFAISFSLSKGCRIEAPSPKAKLRPKRRQIKYHRSLNRLVLAAQKQEITAGAGGCGTVSIK
jgi:hypothetical protein